MGEGVGACTVVSAVASEQEGYTFDSFPFRLLRPGQGKFFLFELLATIRVLGKLSRRNSGDSFIISLSLPALPAAKFLHFHRWTDSTATSAPADTGDMRELVTLAAVGFALPDRKRGAVTDVLSSLFTGQQQKSASTRTLIPKPQAPFHPRDWQDVIHYKWKGNRLRYTQCHVALTMTQYLKIQASAHFRSYIFIRGVNGYCASIIVAL